jgi:hypothetical protein
MRFAALGLSTALSVGVLAPFIGTSSASAVTCTTASSQVAHANTKLAKDKAKLRKAKKKLRKAVHAHKPARVIKHDRKAVKKAKRHVRADKRAHALAVHNQQTCSTGSTGGGSTPAGTANPLSDLFGQLSSILAGVPGGSGAVPTLEQIQKSLSAIPLDPAALTAALEASQASIQESLGNIDPTHASLATVLNAILDPIHDSLVAASGGTGPGADLATTVFGVEQLLTDALGGYDLSLLTDALANAGGGGLPGAGSIPGLGSLTDLFGNIPGLSSLPIPGV